MKDCQMEMDIEFSFKGISYTILPWWKDGILIGPQNSDGDRVFPSPDSLLDGYLIDDLPLRSIIDQVIILL